MKIVVLFALMIGVLMAVGPLSAQNTARSAFESQPGGWTDLMPKPGLPGWTKLPIPATAALDPKEQWAVRDGLLIIDGTGGHEWLRFDGKRYKNFILHAEWRFRKLEGTPRYNGGLYFWASADGSQFYQAQTGEAGGWLFGDFPKDGDRNRTNLREQMTGNRMAPVGEWNTFEVTATAEKYRTLGERRGAKPVGRTARDGGLPGTGGGGFLHGISPVGGEGTPLAGVTKKSRNRVPVRCGLKKRDCDQSVWPWWARNLQGNLEHDFVALRA
ncbi:MAG: DUF1080 domain-containing protein [Bryobacterales bacterium]|nr:DUF1080 domain-containing protein [Bryobacterales bacterium]